jgi:hypothetical protein
MAMFNSYVSLPDDRVYHRYWDTYIYILYIYRLLSYFHGHFSMGNSQLAIFLGSGKVEPFQSSWLWITGLRGFPSASVSSKKWRRG